MDVIPVIDLLGGQVVHARRGERAAYRPIQTPLSPTSLPADVVAGLRRLAPFRHLYIADLDAIQGQDTNEAGDHAAVVAALAAAHPGLGLWLDSGEADPGRARAWLDRDIGALVIGSESQTSLRLLQELHAHPRAVLSLDFRGDAFQGPADILQDVSLWPARVIVMTLARVGANAGPDIARVKMVQARAKGRAVYAAGGVRDASDMAVLKAAGAAGVLVATALHSGAIGTEALAAIAQPDGRAMP